MNGKIMYCAIPTRLRHLREDARRIARGEGYAPVIPFDIGEFEDFEGGSIGRARTIEFMIHVMRFCDTVGIFGISEGVMGEFKDALSRGHELRVFPGFDSECEWQKWYEELKPKYGDLLAELRGPSSLIALVGPSAIGKTHLSKYALEQLGEKLRRVKTTTTRSPRQSDQNDIESYNFVSREEFERGIKERRFYEHDEHLGNYYGSSMADIKNALRRSSGIFAVTPLGAQALWNYRYEINLSFVQLDPASNQVLRKHMERRGITDVNRQQELLVATEKFWLPTYYQPIVMEVTENTEENQKRLLSIVKSIIRPA